MNIFGAFNFGRLIKTFLPGFVILIGLCLMIDSFIAISTPHRLFLKWTSQNAILTTFVSLPLALICGIVSNMVFFTFLTDKLIRNPFNKKNEALNNVQEAFSNWINKHHASQDKLPAELWHDFKDYFDLEYFLLPNIKLEKLLYLQESYWYYLEFQLNITLATLLFAIGAISWSITYFPTLGVSLRIYICLLAVFLLLISSVLFISIKASRLNYDRHRRKLLNLLIGAIYTPNNDK